MFYTEVSDVLLLERKCFHTSLVILVILTVHVIISLLAVSKKHSGSVVTIGYSLLKYRYEKVRFHTSFYYAEPSIVLSCWAVFLRQVENFLTEVIRCKICCGTTNKVPHSALKYIFWIIFLGSVLLRLQICFCQIIVIPEPNSVYPLIFFLSLWYKILFLVPVIIRVEK